MIHMKPDRAIQEGSCRGFFPVFASDTWHKRDGKCYNQTPARFKACPRSSQARTRTGYTNGLFGIVRRKFVELDKASG